MARELATYCESELVLVPKMTHNEPFYSPTIEYWGFVLSRLAVPVDEVSPTEATAGSPGE
jgi:hypothetical protein